MHWYCRYPLSYHNLEEIVLLHKPGLGFKSSNTARRTLKGYETMNMLRKG